MSHFIWLALVSLLTVNVFVPVPCSALTPEEVLKLKAAGVSEETIQLMLQKEPEDKVSSDMVQQGYATEHMGTWKLRDGRIIHSTGKRQLPLHFPTEYPPPPPYMPQLYPYVFLPPANIQQSPVPAQSQQPPQEPSPQPPSAAAPPPR
jgi:hypothetical protein